MEKNYMGSYMGERIIILSYAVLLVMMLATLDDVFVFLFEEDGGFWDSVRLFVKGAIYDVVIFHLIYGFGEIVHLAELNWKLTNKEEKLEEAYQAKVTYLKPDTETVTNTATNFWKCEKCGTKNTINARFCKDCGEYKHKE